MAVTIVFANNKGGVGKTVSAVNLSSLLAEKGLRVLAIDFDPQSNLTFSFGIDYRSLEKSIYDVFTQVHRLEEVIIERYPNLHIIPSVPKLEKLTENTVVSSHKRRNELIKAGFRDLKEHYELILIDTPHSIENLLTMNSMSIADYVLIPVKLGDSFSDLGLDQLVANIVEIRRTWHNRDLQIMGIIGTFWRKTRICNESLDLINRLFPELLFQARIRDNVALSESVSRGLPVNHYKRNSNGFYDYDQLADELLERCKITAGSL